MDKYTFWQALFSLKFVHLWIMLILSASLPYYISMNFKTFGGTFIQDDKFITVAGSFGALFNAFGRIVWAPLFDILGFKIMYFALLMLEMGIAYSFWAVHFTPELYLVWVCACFFILGCHKPLFMTIPAKLYGPRVGGQIYSFLF